MKYSKYLSSLIHQAIALIIGSMGTAGVILSGFYGLYAAVSSFVQFLQEPSKLNFINAVLNVGGLLLSGTILGSILSVASIILTVYHYHFKT